MATEVALALLLLGGTLSMVQSLWNLQRADPGFNPRDVLTISVTAWQDKFAESARRIAFFEELRQRLGALPGVKCAAAIHNLPMRGDYWGQTFYLENEPELPSTQRPYGNMRLITPGYFRAMAIPLLQGRDFDQADQAASQPVVIIDQSFARRYFANQNPLGRRIKTTNRPLGSR